MTIQSFQRGLFPADLLPAKTPPTVHRIDKKKTRFLLYEINGRVAGCIMHGSEECYRWSSGLPADVSKFLQIHSYFQPKFKYLASFVSITNGKYPFIFRDPSGNETEVLLSENSLKQACLTFSLYNDKITISRTVDGNAPLSEKAAACGDILIDPDSRMIYQLAGHEVWKIWENIEEKLLNAEGYDVFDDEFDELDELDGLDLSDESDWSDKQELQWDKNSITANIDIFNALQLRLNPKLFPSFLKTILFFQNGAAVDVLNYEHSSCLLSIPANFEAEIEMIPQIRINNNRLYFSGELFKLFDPRQRSRLSGPLRTKKRLRSMMDACMAMAEVTTPAARKNIIKNTLGNPDYNKRKVKNEARHILNAFAEASIQKPLVIQAKHGKWLLSEDDRMAQVRMVQILYETFGMEAFAEPGVVARVSVKREELFKQLPLLAEKLERNGFSLMMGNEPMATAHWDFALNATSSIHDWFELRPEIRCDGVLLSDEELKRLAEEGILQRNGRLILIDEVSSRILAMLAGTVTGGRKKKKGAQAVRIPRLQILDWLQLRSQGVAVRLPENESRIMESLLNFANIPQRPLPKALSATLRPYQRDGYQWLCFLYEHRFGACLADDMGLGKTVQGISLLSGITDGTIKSEAAPGVPHLIVVPPSLLFNWESEIARFFPDASVLLYGGQRRSTALFNKYDIILTSYGIVQRDIEKLAELRFNVIIFDEAQMVKNLHAATTGAARKLVGAFKLALTGTPVENRIEEYYAIIDLCLPGLLGSPEEFARSVGNRAQGGIETLLRRTRPFVLRRNKKLIAADLPEKIETDIHLDLSPKQRVLYQRTVEEVRGAVHEAFANRSPGQARIMALTAILRLRQICLAPALAIAGTTDASPKLDFLAEQLAELRDEGHSVLVFSQFTSYLDIVEAGLKRHHLPSLRLDGSTPIPQRKQLVQSFQDSDSPLVFLISLKAGGKGLNLTRATYVYHLDPWWNPAVENQASDRAHRIGQTEQVTITRLIMRHTIEEKMMALKEQKLKLYKSILEDGSAAAGTGLTREDFDFLLGD